MEKITTKDLELATLQYLGTSVELRSLRTSLPWECDVLCVSRSYLATEYELKISRADFFNDFKKPKHDQFKKGKGGFISRFIYVVPQGMITAKEVPDYAGLMYYHRIGNSRYITPVKSAKKLSCKKVDFDTMRRLYRSMMFRFLQLNFKDLDSDKVA